MTPKLPVWGIMMIGTLVVSEATAEVTTVLGALGAFLVLLVLLFVYLNSKWCSEPSLGPGNLPCEDPFSVHTEKAYCFDELGGGGTSSESDEDVRRQLAQYSQHIVPTNQSPGTNQPHPLPLPPPQHNIHVNVHTIIKEKPCRNFKDLLSLAEAGRMGRSSGSSSGSTTSADDEQHALRYREKLKGTPVPLQQSCVSEEPTYQTPQDVS
ncbi:hypothetical protein M8J76_010833 [Diaphorina citri]|nr:hypothetical protein M8J76_010833 [Diaphorina citri]